MFECFVTHTHTLYIFHLDHFDDNSLSQMSHLNLSTLIVLFPQSTVLVCLFLLVLVVNPLPHIEQ